MWEKIKAWFKRSETIFWSRLKVVAGAMVGLLTWAVNDPSVNGAIQSLVQPKYLPVYLIVGGLFCEFLRRRN